MQKRVQWAFFQLLLMQLFHCLNSYQLIKKKILVIPMITGQAKYTSLMGFTSKMTPGSHICVSRVVGTWWRHQMETISVLLAICAGNSPVPGEVPAQRPVTRSFDVFFDLRLNKRLSKHSCGWWFKTSSRPLWRHRNVYGAYMGNWGRKWELSRHIYATLIKD